MPLNHWPKAPSDRLIPLGHYPTRGERIRQAETAVLYEHIRPGLAVQGHVGRRVAGLVYAWPYSLPQRGQMWQTLLPSRHSDSGQGAPGAPLAKKPIQG